MKDKIVAHLTARGLTAEELSQAYSIFRELEDQSEANLRSSVGALRSELTDEQWARTASLIESYRDLAIQICCTAFIRGLRQGATDFLDRIGPPVSDMPSEMPTDADLRRALDDVRGDSRAVLAGEFGLDSAEVMLAQAVGVAVAARQGTDAGEVSLAKAQVAAYAFGRLKGERREWERVRQHVLDLWSS